jgi:hypothetical protein
MTQASADHGAGTSKTAQDSLRLVAQAISRAPLDQLAAAINKDDSTVSRVRSGDAKVSMDDAIRLLHAVGLRVVPIDSVVVNSSKYEAVLTMATAAMADPEIARRLTRAD